METSRPAWTLAEAAERTATSRSTLRRYRDAGKFPSAYKDSSGMWRFPLEDLLAAGLTPAEQHTERAQIMVSEQPKNAEAERIAQLEQALREERLRADRAEDLAASYRENLADVRLALRMLEAGKPQSTGKPELAHEVGQSEVSEQATEQGHLPTVTHVNTPRPTLWGRLTGARRHQ